MLPRAAAGGDPVVEVGETTAGEDDPQRPLWQRVAERESMHRFDLTREFGFRVTWVPRTGGGHLIVNAPHAVVDGISLMRLLHEVLEEAARPSSASSTSLPPTPAVLDQLPLNAILRAVGRIAKTVTVRQQRTYAKRSLLPIEGQLSAARPLATHACFRVGEKSAYLAVRARCKSQGVTVGGLFTAAVEWSVLRYARELEARPPLDGEPVRMPVSMDFSLRRMIPGASVSQSSVGLFTGVADVGVTVKPDATLWDLARLFSAQAKRQIKLRTPLLFHQALDGMFDLDAELRKYGIEYGESGGVADGVNVSNVGPYPYETAYGACTLRHVFGLNGPVLGGPMLIFWLRSIGDRFCFNATGTAPACSRSRVERIASYVADIMDRAGTPLFDDVSIATYVNGEYAD